MFQLLDFFFPRICEGCGKKGAYLCFECKKELSPHPEICPFCHVSSRGGKTCSSCIFSHKGYLDGLVIGFSYEKKLKKLILKLKFAHKKDLAEFFAERLALFIQTHSYLLHYLHKRELYLVSIPSHWYRKYFQKGYNQSELLSSFLAQQLQIPYSPCLKKNKATVSQLSLKREKRLVNLAGAFSFGTKKEFPKSACILLIDDVTTTGATLNEAAKVLKMMRPDLQVWGIVVARHMG